MKKRFLVIFTLFISLFMLNKVNASSANINIYSNKSLVITGDVVTVTVKLSSNSNLGSWNFDVIPSSNLSLVSSSYGGLYIVESASNLNTKSKTYTFKFKAKSSGTGTVSVKNIRVVDMDSEQNMSVAPKSTSFKMMTRGELEATYSKNNNLSNLKVEGYELDSEFDKNKLEYNLELEYGTKSINIIANKEDNRASISGVGNIDLSQGLNVINIIVTAQNGSTKTYKINATVKELDPINVKLNGEEYNVIREKKFLPPCNMLFTEKTIKIDDKDVPAYYNEASDFTLVGLKNKQGEINLYIYDGQNYKKYEDFKTNTLMLYLLDMDENLLPEGYIKNNIKIGEKEIIAYVNPKHEFPLIYGLNLETGIKNLYKYDSKENTLQRLESNPMNNEKLYFNVMIGMGIFIVFSYILFIFKANKNKNTFLATDSLNISEISADPINEILNIKSKKELKKAKKLAKKNRKKNKDNKEMADL